MFFFPNLFKYTVGWHPHKKFVQKNLKKLHDEWKFHYLSYVNRVSFQINVKEIAIIEVSYWKSKIQNIKKNPSKYLRTISESTSGQMGGCDIQGLRTFFTLLRKLKIGTHTITVLITFMFVNDEI
jgi:hypothetical protein